MFDGMRQNFTVARQIFLFARNQDVTYTPFSCGLESPALMSICCGLQCTAFVLSDGHDFAVSLPADGCTDRFPAVSSPCSSGRPNS